MSDIGRLVWASVYLSGPYLNGEGREATYTHEVIKGQRVTTLLHDFDLVIRSLHGQEILQRGPRAVVRAGVDRMDELDMSPDFVADVALSQLHPGWVLEKSARTVRTTAETLYKSRVIAQLFHESNLAYEQTL